MQDNTALHDTVTMAAPAGESGLSAFSGLVQVLGTSTKTNEKLQALTQYFSTADDTDKVWVIALFSGRRPRRMVSAALLQQWCCEIAGLPLWLFEESYHTVGDLGETIALLLPEKINIMATQSLAWYLEQIIALEKVDENIKKEFITGCWMQMTTAERFVFNKLLTGGFRIGVSQKLIVNALGKTLKSDPSIIAHRISGKWDPVTTTFDELLGEGSMGIDHSKPYPFYLAYALDESPAVLGEPFEWQAEWKWDGIRGQLIKRNNELFVWSRGEELITEKFPEYDRLKELLPNGIALDGEIIPHNGAQVLPFAVLQTRIGRKNITKKQLTEAPIAFIAYDVPEYNGEDYRTKSLTERRTLLEQVAEEINHSALMVSPIINFDSWEQLKHIREQSRAMNAEGLMLKRSDAPYGVGRRKGGWWKWKIEPYAIDAVMVYAQPGHGRRALLHTDYTFAVW
ncbi:MAG: cisplatin damage response ATP-dependent DNA ligase, partial [Panacibacter sp.]